MSEERVNKMLRMVVEQCIDKSSQVLSKTLKAGAKIELKNVDVCDLSDVTAAATNNSREVIATVIDLVGDAPFKFLFFVSIRDALILTDLFLGQEPGTTDEFNEYASSTIQEIGNIISSAITNVFVANFQISLLPDPPDVIHDFSATIFEEFIVDAAMEQDEVLLIESKFQIVRNELDCHMYLFPQAGSDTILGYSAGS